MHTRANRVLSWGQSIWCDTEVRAWIALDVNPATDGCPLETEATTMKMIMEANTNTATNTKKMKIMAYSRQVGLFQP